MQLPLLHGESLTVLDLTCSKSAKFWRMCLSVKIPPGALATVFMLSLQPKKLLHIYVGYQELEPPHLLFPRKKRNS